MIAAAPLLLAIGLLAGRWTARAPAPTYQQLTFQRGTIVSARFAPDGDTILYGASWSGRPFELFSVRPESPLSKPLGFAGDILSISPSGDMALSLGRHYISSFDSAGTLAQVSLSGSAPRPILEGVEWADWGPDGRTLAVVRRAETGDRLEYPIGKTVYQSTGWIGRPRFSSSGEIGLEDHPSFGGDNGSLVVVDASGKVLRRSTGWASLQGVAWSADGREVWFTATRQGGNRSLWALSPSGKERLLETAPGVLTIMDVRGDRVLLSRDIMRVAAVGHMAGFPSEKDLSYLDYTAVRDLSPDGKMLLFDEDAEGGGPHSTAYILRAGDADPVRLCDGASFALSPDGKWAVTLPSFWANNHAQFVLLPTGVGTPVPLAPVTGTPLSFDWTPDGKNILYGASDNGRPSRLWLQEVASGKAKPISAEGVEMLLYSHLISPDSKFVIARGSDRALRLYPLAGGPPRPLPGVAPAEQPLRWSSDGGSLYVYTPGPPPVTVERLRLSDGRREVWKQLVPADTAGAAFIRPPVITPDGRFYVYCYPRVLSEVFLVRGIR